jgi:transposase
LWIFANTNFALFHAADTRSRAELEIILGLNYDGVVSSDDYSVYNGYDVKAQQKCLAHLRRHFKKLLKLPGLNNLEIGKVFIKLIDEAFRNYAKFQQNQDILEFLSWASQFKLLVESSINEWIEKAGGEAGKLIRSLREKAHQWWYFLDHPQIPPDHNLAERTLRLAVTKRKVSGGSRSMQRFTDTANLLTVIQTCRRQGRSVIEFFVQASYNSNGQPFCAGTISNTSILDLNPYALLTGDVIRFLLKDSSSSMHSFFCDYLIFPQALF